MRVIAKDQTKREYCIALFNQYLHENNICPGNHTVDYSRGWFYFDGLAHQRPDLTAKADELLKAKTHIVLYCGDYNTYVLHERLTGAEDES